MKEELENSQKPLFTYCEVEKNGNVIEDFYDYYLGIDDVDDDEENEETIYVDSRKMSKEDFLNKYKDSTEFEEWQEEQWDDLYEEIYQGVIEESNKLLGTKSYTKVDGFQQRWNGKYSDIKIIKENTIQEIIKNYLKLDILTIEVFEDKIKLINRHHDGTNIYEFYPFNFNDFKKEELKGLINKHFFEEYTNKKLEKASKDDLINFLDETYFEN